MIVLAFVAAAAAGALIRAETCRRLNRTFPFGTLFVNVAGSFAIGLISNVTGAKWTVFAVGMLGSFTTVSSFARDSVALLVSNRVRYAAGYVALSITLGVFAAFCGEVIVGKVA